MGEAPNGWRKTMAAVISGGAVGFCLAAIAGLMAMGGERQKVLDHVATTEPLRQQAQLHIASDLAHLDANEALTLATVPLRLDRIDRQIEEINKKLDLLLRQTR